MEGIILTCLVIGVLYVALGITEFVLWAGNKVYDWQIDYRLRRNYRKMYAFCHKQENIGIDDPEEWEEYLRNWDIYMDDPS